MGYSGPPQGYGYNMPSFYPVSSSGYPTPELIIDHSTIEGDYIYAVYQKMLNVGGGNAGESGLAVFEISDDCDYVSHITLASGSGSSSNEIFILQEIVVQDDLAILGAYDNGIVYLVDVSDKDEPELINKLNIGKGRITGLTIQNQVVFICEERSVSDSNKNIIYAYDVSAPDDTDEDDDLLDSYTIDDYDVQGMELNGDYLYISGREYDEDPSILVFNVSDQENISLVSTIDDLGGDEYGTVGLAVNGDYLFSTIDLSGGSSDYEDHEYKFKIINVSDPQNPEIVFSSDKLEGAQLYGARNIVINDNYAYLSTTIGSIGDWDAFILGGGLKIAGHLALKFMFLISLILQILN